MNAPKIAVCFETFVAFRFGRIPASGLPEQYAGREQQLTHTEMMELLSSLFEEQDAQVELGGMYVLAQHLARRGFDTTYLARLGEDSLGRHLTGHLSAGPVRAIIQNVRDNHTGILAIVHDGPEVAAYYASRGANNFRTDTTNRRLDTCEPEELRQAIEGADWVYMSGYTLFAERSGECAAELLNELSTSGARLILDVAGAAMHRCLRSDVFHLLRHAHIVKMDRAEAASLTGDAELPRQVDALRREVVEDAIVLLSLGPEGCLGLTKTESVHVPCPPVPNVLNLDGAGDVLLAAFVQGYLRQCASVARSLERAVQQACDWIQSGPPVDLALDPYGIRQSLHD